MLKKYPIPVLRLFNYLVFPSFNFFGLCLLSFFSLFCRTLCCMSSFILRLLTDYLFGILDVWFVFTSSCLKKGPCLIYVSCVCLCIVVSNTYCVVFLKQFFSLFIPYVACFSGLSIFDCPFGILWHLLKVVLLSLMFLHLFSK